MTSQITCNKLLKQLIERHFCPEVHWFQGSRGHIQTQTQKQDESGSYPYFSASSRAFSVVTTARWSSRSDLFPHKTTSGFSQYACVCSWPARDITAIHHYILLFEKLFKIMLQQQQAAQSGLSIINNNNLLFVVNIIFFSWAPLQLAW